MIVIGHDIDYSYLGLGITHSQPFCERYVVIVLYVLCYFLLALLRDYQCVGWGV